MKEKLNCWEYRKCAQSECPAFGKKDVFCWTISGGKKSLVGLESSNAIKKCLACEVFKVNAVSDPKNGFVGLINQLYFELEKIEDQHLLFRKISSLVQSTLELDKTLHIILTCVTAGYGLGFNRAMLLLIAESGEFLEDRMVVAPSSKEEAYKVWQEIALLDVSSNNLPDLVSIHESGFESFGEDYKPGKLAISLREDNIFTRCMNERRAVLVDYKYRELLPGAFVSFWGAEVFAAAPVISKDKVRGIIVADNFVNNRDITREYLDQLSSFAYHAGLAIDNALLYESLEKRAKELEETNERLKEAREILMRNEKLTAMGEMAAVVAHEMRTPLISIGGFARILREKVKGNQTDLKHAEIMIEETIRLEKIIRDVLDFARPFELTLTPVNVKKVIKEAVFIVETSRKIKGKISIDPVFEIETVLADAERLKQVIINVLENSLDSQNISGSGEKVGVSVKKKGSLLLLEVRDYGAGIKAEYVDKVIRPFFTTKKGGIGLGLSIARKIIHEHRGVLSIIPADVGVVVRIELPAEG